MIFSRQGLLKFSLGGFHLVFPGLGFLSLFFLFGVRFMAGQFGAYDSCNLKSAFLSGVGAVQAELLIMLHTPFKLHKFTGALGNLSAL